jgi:hypothetical protein
MNLQTRREILTNIRNQYQEAGWLKKGKILDGFVAASGYDRKYAIKLLNSKDKIKKQPQAVSPGSNTMLRLSRRLSPFGTLQIRFALSDSCRLFPNSFLPWNVMATFIFQAMLERNCWVLVDQL